MLLDLDLLDSHLEVTQSVLVDVKLIYLVHGTVNIKLDDSIIRPVALLLL